jgi:DNA-binding MarR family transcriptional regulator
MNRLREISKISRNVALFKNKKDKAELASNAYEVTRLIVKHPGETSLFLADRLNADKAYVSRLVSDLIKKGYLKSEIDKDDKRKKHLYPSSKAKELKIWNEEEDDLFYSHLEKFIAEEDKEAFYKTLDKLYAESKRLRLSKFKDLE